MIFESWWLKVNFQFLFLRITCTNSDNVISKRLNIKTCFNVPNSPHSFSLSHGQTRTHMLMCNDPLQSPTAFRIDQIILEQEMDFLCLQQLMWNGDDGHLVCYHMMNLKKSEKRLTCQNQNKTALDWKKSFEITSKTTFWTSIPTYKRAKVIFYSSGNGRNGRNTYQTCCGSQPTLRVTSVTCTRRYTARKLIYVLIVVLIMCI